LSSEGINPGNSVFILLSFEGPDIYSMAGGLGVRVTELSRALAHGGFETHLFFIGDPTKPGHEVGEHGRWHLHRWAQWISALHVGGVYQGEEEKIADWERSLPAHLIDAIIRPATQQGKVCVILAEEWHTASSVVNLHQLLRWAGMRERCILFWNANNTFGFWRIQWDALRNAATLTTVSKYMKHKMWSMGLNPLVIPNGIPTRLLHPPSPERVAALRQIFRVGLNEGALLAKVGRFDPDKRWIMAVDALHILKSAPFGARRRPRMIIRGGMEPHRVDVVQRALMHDLSWAEVTVSDPTYDNILRAIADNAHADILELRFFVPEEFLRTIYGAADAVFANSGHEPFGLVGLEVMASGGIAFTGCTGEDYAQSFHNAVVVDSEDAREMAVYVINLMTHPEEKRRIRRNAHETARNFTWEEVLKELYRKLEFSAQVGGVVFHQTADAAARLAI
jgi:glycosyltransferase involved in cell wall biosynthesis